MKKRIILFLSIILLIICTGMIFLFINKSKISGFPHFKQANIECEGSIYCLENEKFKIPIVIVDEEELSEMASTSNIKAIYLVDKNSEKISALEWQIQNGYKDKGYIMRSIDCYFIYEKSGIYNPEYVDIQFVDGKTERFTLGKIDILVKTKSDFQENCISYWFGVQLIKPLINSKTMASGVILLIDTSGKEVIIEDIDLGIRNFGIDVDNITVLDGEYDYNYFNSLRDKHDKSVKIFDSIQIRENIEGQFKPIHIAASDNTTKYTTLLIPLITKEGVSNSDKVVCINPTIKIIQDGKHKELYEFQPTVSLPRINKDFLPAKLLREKGI